MKRIHIVGRSSPGKTTLMVALLEEFTRRGVRVGSIKHSAHNHELDRPGKDSHRHRMAGAAPAGIITSDLVASYQPRELVPEPYVHLAPLFNDCSFVLVEGDMGTDATRLEVFRLRDETPAPMAVNDRKIAAVISDDSPEVSCPIWPRSDVPGIADRILSLLESS